MEPQQPMGGPAPAPVEPDQQPAGGMQPVKSGGKGKLIGVVAVIGVLLLAAGAYAMFGRDKDEQPQQEQQQTTQQQEEQAAEPEGCEEGFTEFAGDNLGLHFCYPVSWGNASLEDGEEEKMGHLTAGSHNIITFSSEEIQVRAGLMSKDWTHNEDQGHGGIPGQNGYTSLEQAKEAKDHIKASYVYVDTQSQFAYIRVCGEFCLLEGESTDRLELSFTVKIDGNARYDVIEFTYGGPALGDELYTDGALDEDKLAAADLTADFPKTGETFQTMQKVADSVRN